MPAPDMVAERKLAEFIVTCLNLEGVTGDSIDPEAPLFGGGLGLDSIDALELALGIYQQYGLQLRSDDESNKKIFASVRALSEFIQQHRKL